MHLFPDQYFSLVHTLSRMAVGKEIETYPVLAIW
jgi:hypothetical protein